MQRDDLEQFIDRELKRLPTPRAPGSLLPRVMAAAAAHAELPWYRRPWLTWQRAWRAASLVMPSAVAVLVFLFVQGTLGEPADVIACVAPGAAAYFNAVADSLGRGATVVRVLWWLLVAPVVASTLVLGAVLSLACAALWAALQRIALAEGSAQ